MKILILASGGDAPGMNKFIAVLYRKFGSSLYACRGGFKGLYEGDIVPASYFEPLKFEHSAGCCIKCGRFIEFKEKPYFEQALKNALCYDALIVLGGNGSKKGVKELSSRGVKAVFVPGTIDNDVDGSDYSIGFHTAVSMVCYAIRNVMPSMESHSRSCIFETMGRRCGNIAENAAKIIKPDFLISKESDLDKEKLEKVIKKRYEKGSGAVIILRENIVDPSALAKQLSKDLSPIEVRHFAIAHLQRGGKPTKAELKYASEFAHGAIKAIKNMDLPIAVIREYGKVVLKKF